MCSTVQRTAAAGLSELAGATSYTFAAYSDSSCSTLLATASAFTTLDLTASAITNTAAKLTISGHSTAWWYIGSGSGATCTAVAANTASADVTGLNAVTTYVYRAYDAAGCASSDEIASETFRTHTTGRYFEFDIPDLVARVGEAFSYELPELLCSSVVQCRNNYKILTPATLPTWLSFDTSTRVLSGTPTAPSAEAAYTYEATNTSQYEKYLAQFELTVQAAQDLSLSKSRVALTEGSSSTGTYTVKLPTAPTGAVTVTITSADTAAVTVDTDTTTDGNQDTLTFTAANYSTAQTVTLAAVGDADGVDESVTITHSASGGSYDDKSAALTAAVTDDDRAFVLLPAPPLRVNKGSSGSLTVALAARPADTVTVTVTIDVAHATVDTDTAATGTQNTLTFTTANYNTAQTVSIVSTVADSDGNAPRVLRFSAFGGGYDDTSADHNLLLEGVTSTAAVTLSASTLTLTEGGSAATFTVKLTGPTPNQTTRNPIQGERPNPAITVTVTSSDTGAATVDTDTNTLGNQSELTFQTTDYTTAQIVTVTPADDNDADTETVTITASTKDWDHNYAGESATLTATVTDDEPSLTASAVTQTTATLTIANHTGNWYYKHTTPASGTCSSAVSTTTASLTTLTAATAYTYAAYSDSACTTLIATADAFTTLDLTASDITQTTATLTIANHTDVWYYKHTTPASGTCSLPVRDTTASLTTLTGATAYTYAAYSDRECTTLLATAAAFTTPDLTASAINLTTATLTISGHTAAWWYKQTAPSEGTCTSVAEDTATADLTSLTDGTAHTYKAYDATGCNDADEIASETFTTLEVTLTASDGHPNNSHLDHRQPHRQLVLPVHHPHRRDLFRSHQRHHR